MDRRLFTVIEIAIILGLIAAVLYFGGVFNTGPAPTPAPPITVAVVTLTPATPVAVGGTPTPTRLPAPATPPLAEPGGQIAFNSMRDGNVEIYLTDAQGSELRNLTNHNADDFILAWSPDGSRLAFFSTRSGWLELYVMDADGANVLRLTDTRESQTMYTYPVSWAPDGSFLLAQRHAAWRAAALQETTFIDRIAADGSGAREVYFDQADMGWVTLAPEGDYVAMLDRGRQGYGVYAAHLAADGLMQPQPVSLDCYSYLWAADGQQLTCGSGPDYFNILPGSADKHMLFTSTASLAWFGNLWSPDGRNLLMRRVLEEPGPDQAPALHGLRLHSVNGSYRDLLPEAHLPPHQFIVWSWAPDSQWIVFTSARYGQQDLFLLNVYDANSLRQLTTAGGNFSPLWRP